MTAAILTTPDRPGPAIPAPRQLTRLPLPRPYLTPVPDCEPPFDDEWPASGRVRCLPDGGRTPRRGPLPTVIVDDEVPGFSREADVGVRRTHAADLPPAGRNGRVLARALVEVLAGARPLEQLRAHCAPEVFAGIAARPTVRGNTMPRLTSVRVSEPSDGVAEVTAVFRRGDRARVFAFRLQGLDGRWRMTALQLG